MCTRLDFMRAVRKYRASTQELAVRLYLVSAATVLPARAAACACFARAFASGSVVMILGMGGPEPTARRWPAQLSPRRKQQLLQC
jgi:hypothetical protein